MAKSGPLCAQNVPALGIDQVYVLKEAVLGRPPASFVVEIGRCVVNEKGDWRNRKDTVIVKAAERCSGELDSISVSARVPV